jgi:hypothetical protein
MGVITIQIQYDGPLTAAQVKKRVREVLAQASVSVQSPVPAKRPTRREVALQKMRALGDQMRAYAGNEPDTMTDEEVVADVRVVRRAIYLENLEKEARGKS